MADPFARRHHLSLTSNLLSACGRPTPRTPAVIFLCPLQPRTFVVCLLANSSFPSLEAATFILPRFPIFPHIRSPHLRTYPPPAATHTTTPRHAWHKTSQRRLHLRNTAVCRSLIVVIVIQAPLCPRTESYLPPGPAVFVVPGRKTKTRLAKASSSQRQGPQPTHLCFAKRLSDNVSARGTREVTPAFETHPRPQSPSILYQDRRPPARSPRHEPLTWEDVLRHPAHRHSHRYPLTNRIPGTRGTGDRQPRSRETSQTRRHQPAATHADRELHPNVRH